MIRHRRPSIVAIPSLKTLEEEAVEQAKADMKTDSNVECEQQWRRAKFLCGKVISDFAWFVAISLVIFYSIHCYFVARSQYRQSLDIVRQATKAYDHDCKHEDLDDDIRAANDLHCEQLKIAKEDSPFHFMLLRTLKEEVGHIWELYSILGTPWFCVFCVGVLGAAYVFRRNTIQQVDPSQYWNYLMPWVMSMMNSRTKPQRATV
jgi:hypothetical protein